MTGSTGRFVAAAAAFAAATLGSVLAAPAAGQRATFQGIGHRPGGIESRASAVSGDGRVVVGAANGADGGAAVRWTVSEGLEALAPAPGWGGPGWQWQASAASGDGAVIVGIGKTPAREHVAFRWTRPAGMVDLGALPGETEARAWNISADGSTIVGDSDLQPFRWTEAGGMEQYPREVWFGLALAISDDLSTVIGMYGARGFRTTPAESMTFGVHQEPNAVSSDGSVFVGYESGGPGALRWVEGSGFESMQLPPGAEDSGASAVSADGSVVVGWIEETGRDAFLWDEVRGFRLLRDELIVRYGLDLTGWRLTGATGVSADGTVIVGSGINPAGQQEGWVARLGNGPCYADCDASGAIDFFDFLCYQDSFAAAEPWADCDGSGALDLLDFLCFQNAFATGCP